MSPQQQLSLTSASFSFSHQKTLLYTGVVHCLVSDCYKRSLKLALHLSATQHRMVWSELNRARRTLLAYRHRKQTLMTNEPQTGCAHEFRRHLHLVNIHLSFENKTTQKKNQHYNHCHATTQVHEICTNLSKQTLYHKGLITALNVVFLIHNLMSLRTISRISIKTLCKQLKFI